MERILVLLLALFSASAWAANPAAVGIVPNTSYTGNGSGLIPLECLSGTGACNIFTISAGDANAALTAAHYAPFYKNGGLGTPSVIPYQVSNGKTAYCFNLTGTTGIASGSFQLLSSSNSFGYDGTPTGVIYYQTGAAGKYANIMTAANTVQPMPGTFQFSQNYFPGIQVATTHAYTAKMDCYEK